MSSSDFINSGSCYLEIGQDALHAVNGEAGLDLPLERQSDGRLTPGCKERVTAALQAFLQKQFWQPRQRVFCAIGARGVSLRRLSLPTAGKEELQRLLLLQIESEFPLPPDQLAWGFSSLGASKPHGNGASGIQELLVVAVKKEALEDYAAILEVCGASPVFTVAALARAYLCPGAAAVLDVGRNYSELVTLENGMPTAVRVLPWGSDTGAESAEPLLQPLNGQPVGGVLYVTATNGGQGDIASQLARSLSGSVECKSVELAPGQGRSAAVLGLRKAIESEPGRPPLILKLSQTNGNGNVARPAPWKWAALAVGLAFVALALPYAEAVLFKPRLEKRLAALKADRGRLATIDRELDFMKYLKQNEPPYLDALYLISKAAPPGGHFDSIAMNKRGDLALRGSMKDSQQVVDFRSKLIDSGFFANVAVEEQTPTPDRQKVNLRMTAQWKPAGERPVLSVPASTNKTSDAKMPGMEFPGGMPPGMGQMMPTMQGLPPGVELPPVAARARPPRTSRSAGTSPPAEVSPPAGTPPVSEPNN